MGIEKITKPLGEAKINPKVNPKEAKLILVSDFSDSNSI